jgi:glycosyltransferase involved in cell wall biosynthesis
MKGPVQPLVSVGIPCFNRPKGLRHTLEQITQQTYQNLEIIVSDNCSEDEGVEAVGREFAGKDTRVVYRRQARNEGPNFNFAYVLGEASGEYFVWASDDDEHEPDFIRVCIENIGDASLAMTAMGRKNLQTGEFSRRPDVSLNSLNSTFKNARNYINSFSSIFFYGLHRREDILYVLDLEMFDWFDSYVTFQHVLQGGVVYVPEYLGFISNVDEQAIDRKRQRMRDVKVESLVEYVLALVKASESLGYWEKKIILYLFFKKLKRIK